MDILIQRMEMYRIMVEIFYRRLDKQEQLDALTEAAERIKSEVLGEYSSD